MPTYDYLCDACGYESEVMQSFGDDLLKKCPKCNKNKFRQLISGGIGLMFKGSGFYVTDSNSSSATNTTKD